MESPEYDLVVRHYSTVIGHEALAKWDGRAVDEAAMAAAPGFSRYSPPLVFIVPSDFKPNNDKIVVKSSQHDFGLAAPSDVTALARAVAEIIADRRFAPGSSPVVRAEVARCPLLVAEEDYRKFCDGVGALLATLKFPCEFIQFRLYDLSRKMTKKSNIFIPLAPQTKPSS